MGIFSEAAAGHSTEVFDGVDETLYEAGGVSLLDKLHVGNAEPTQHHHEGADSVQWPVLVQVGQATSVFLGMLASGSLATQSCLSLVCPPAGTNAVGHRSVTTAYVREHISRYRHPLSARLSESRQHM